MINDLDEVSFAYLLAPTFQFVNSAGKPITGGWMEVYIHGTRTKYYCVSDWDGTLHPFKIPLDSLGSNIVLASPANAYDVYVYNRFGSLIMSRYNVIPSTGGASGVIPATISIESDDETVNISVSGNTYNLSIGDTVDKLNTVSGDVEELKAAIASGFDQVQVDWEQTDSSAVDYIKNKPDLSIYATNELVETVSGDIVNLVNVGDTNLYNLVSSVSSTLETNIENASGNLVDIINAVSSEIPTQMQSDWIEDDASSPSYIQNKPTEKQLVAGDNIGISVSGNDVIISASGTDLSDYATHTEVNNVSGEIINVVSSVSSTLHGEIENIPEQVNSDWNAVSGKAEILNKPDLSVYATNDSVNSVSSILNDKINSVSSAIPEPFEGYTSPSGTSYINNTNYIIEQSNSAIDITTINDWSPTMQMSITTTQSWPGGFTASSNEIKFVTNTNTTGTIRIYKVYEGTDYVEGTLDDSKKVILNLPDDYLNDTVWVYYDGQVSRNFTIYQRVGQPITTEIVRQLAWNDDLMSVSASIPDVSNFVSETELVSAIGVITSTIPQAQVQSNWTETDTSDPSYIQNKPDEINIVAGSGINIVASGTDLVISSNGGGGVEYTAGYGIQILNDVISVSGINPQVNADWNADSGVSQILNKPDEVEIVAGSGINITESNNQLIISSTVSGGGGGGSYTAGDHIDITNDTISVTGITELVAGTNITITMNSDSAVISAAGGQQVQSNWDEWDSSSPAYIQNKPSIPQSPEQSDWNETDPYSLAYIKNKPNITDAYTGASGIAIDDSVISLDEPLGIVAGSGINIVIEGNSAIICVSGVSGGGTEYQEGYGIDIDNDTISVDTTVIPDINAVSAMIASASGSNNLFIATYLYTNYSDVISAYNDGKYIVCRERQSSANQTYKFAPLFKYDSTNQTFYFVNTSSDTTNLYEYKGDIKIITVKPSGSNNGWYSAGYSVNPDWLETNTQSINYIQNKPDLSVYTTSTQVSAIVEAATGSIPTPTQVNADWSATSGVAEILNKPVEANLLPGSGITIAASGNDYVINASNPTITLSDLNSAGIVDIQIVNAASACTGTNIFYLIPEE